MRKHTGALLLFAALLSGASLPIASPALAAGSTDSDVTVSLAPNHDATWAMSVTNMHEEPAEVVFDVVSVSGPVFAGETPASLAVEQQESEIDAADAGADLAGLQVDLGTLEPGETLTLDGRAALPAEADDSYRDASGVVTWRFSLMVDGEAIPPVPSPPGPPLPATGGLVPVALLAVAAGGVVAGSIMARRRRRGEAS